MQVTGTSAQARRDSLGLGLSYIPLCLNYHSENKPNLYSPGPQNKVQIAKIFTRDPTQPIPSITTKTIEKEKLTSIGALMMCFIYMSSLIPRDNYQGKHDYFSDLERTERLAAQGCHPVIKGDNEIHALVCVHHESRLQPAPQHCLLDLTASFFLLLVPTYKLLPST